MKNLKKDAVFTALLTTVCSVVPAYAGDNSIVGCALGRRRLGSFDRRLCGADRFGQEKVIKKDRPAGRSFLSVVYFSSMDFAVRMALSPAENRMVTLSPTLRITAISLAEAETA